DSTDCSDKAFITGNTGVTSSDQDVDNGATTLISPLFDLTTYTEPYLDYSRWFYNSGGSGLPNDSLSIYLSNGTTTCLLEFVLAATPGSSTWVHRSFKISDYINPTATMQLKVRTADNNPGHIVEAGFDKFLINEGPTGISENNSKNTASINVYPNPFAEETTIAYQLKNKLVAGASIVITDVTGRTVNAISLTQAKGTVVFNSTSGAGIYFVRVINGNEIGEPLKIVKMK
ncbi:MAG: T9SS type A sorting domain-containing protein, partial [Bacteroidetes bacterium]|nr:T9SS type A sorting domain-containing protein [Bacteroidota bacterium]